MPYTALAVLIAAAIISFTLARGFQHMAKTVTDAAADVSAAVAAIAVTIAGDLQLIADSISEHVANGTAVTAIEEQVDKLNALNAQLVAGTVPPAGDDTGTAPAGDDTLSAPSGDDSVSG